MSKEKQTEVPPSTDQLVSEIARLEKKFNIIVNHAESVEIWVQRDLTVAFISPGIEKISGYPAEQFIRDPGFFRNLIHPDDLAGYSQYYEGTKEIREPDGIDRRIIRKDGEIRWIHTRLTSLYDDQGNYDGFRTSTTDITKRKIAETELQKAYLQIKELEENYRIVADNTHDMERWVLPDKTLAYISPSCERLTGYSTEEYMENPNLLVEIIHPDDRECFISRRNESFLGNLTEQGEFRIITKKGEIRWISFAVQKVTGKEGNGMGFRSSYRDITSRKELESELEKRNKMFSSLAEGQVDLIIRTSGDGIISYINDSYAGFFGLKKESVMNRKYVEVADKSDIEKTQRSAMLLNKENPVVKVTFNYPRQNGDLIYLEWIFRGFFDEAGQMTDRLDIGRDVTENVILNQKLKQAEELYGSIVENQSDLIIIHLPDSTILFVNDSFARFNGVKAEDLIGKKWFDLIPHEVALKVKLLMESLTPDNPPAQFEMVLKRFDGKERWFSWISTGVFNMNSHLTALQVIGRDITSMKETENQLKKALYEVEQLKLKFEQENLYLREKFLRLNNPAGMITDSSLMHEVIEKVNQVAQTDSPVLIFGETGTGKELVAQAIHNASPRRKRLMITINCSALPPSLIESELFGRERGAYTGALSRQIGRFEQAHNSTLFLDEIGELLPEIQVKLLRVIQFGEFQLLGNPETKKVNVRIIAATNKDLSRAITEGTFRSDLFYRLNVFPINVPPLRERKEDIPLLALSFVDEIAGKMGKRIDKIATQSMNKLLRYHWPGNVRELKNLIEYNIILSKSPTLEIQFHDADREDDLSENLHAEQRRHIEKILNQTGWRIRGSGGAAEKLGMKESTLRFRMKKLGIERKK